MWNDHQSLNFLANILLTGVLLATIYVVGTRILALPFFSLREVRVEAMDKNRTGNVSLVHITRDQIEQVVRNSANGNFIMIDLKTLQNAFMELPWVRSVKILREWPPALNILLEEHKPLAYWEETALVNTNGEIFHAIMDNVRLPVFAGPDNSSRLITQQYRIFNKLLQPTGQTAIEIVLTPRHAWHVRLNTGTWLKLGREQIEQRLKRYVAVRTHIMKVWIGMEVPLMWICAMPAGLQYAYPDIALNLRADKHYDYEIGGIFK
ncbi:cell division protein FtsQ/DivIB [Nitrosomonas europaea]|uniref:Cell division protein FtsQ n=1 Tax=Nitrosomonas europaea (strain ATCC 19718 / CIP 103999 / KCTC 2705 / NBRC 14298) TaxID=228410 RepID=Q82VR9_NITEU|nr:cell division protein FtsQ/DivIB [Nitrosomonas europaea]CAD84906.1 putative cell division transmembrane protein [Nitrosomonas europaea ATCC 19718]